jgi:ABC-2 type transport system ATP-binding protein
VTVNGTPYRQHRYPLHEVGALLEAKAIHPGRSSYNHLLAVAQSNGFGPRRVRQVLELVGLEKVASRRAGQYSLGMGQSFMGTPRRSEMNASAGRGDRI